MTMTKSKSGDATDRPAFACCDGKRHWWPDGWACDKCGIRRVDYEEMKRHNDMVTFTGEK